MRTLSAQHLLNSVVGSVLLLELLEALSFLSPCPVLLFLLHAAAIGPIAVRILHLTPRTRNHKPIQAREADRSTLNPFLKPKAFKQRAPDA